jgi:hypothetical protein
MTPKEASDIITLGQLSGLEPDPSIANNLRGASMVYAQVLTLAGVDFPMAEAAMLAIVSEPWRSEYRRKLPTTGEIIARTPLGQAVTALGSTDDSARAFEDFRARMRALAFQPSRHEPSRHLDPADPYRNDAMFTALESYGGSIAWGKRDTEDPWRVRESEAKWRASYAAAREAQRHDRGAVASVARVIAERPALRLVGPVAEAK